MLYDADLLENFFGLRFQFRCRLCDGLERPSLGVLETPFEPCLRQGTGTARQMNMLRTVQPTLIMLSFLDSIVGLLVRLGVLSLLG